MKYVYRPVVSEINTKPNDIATSTDNSINLIESVDAPTKYVRVRRVPVSSSTDSIPPTTTVNSPNQNINTNPYSYLFEEKKDANTSNIVGYFAYGAFIWYVPNWLVSNWDMKPFRSEGMIFSPKIRENYDEFSDIIFSVSTSTESNNAENVYLTIFNSIPKDEIIINEILLSKGNSDGIINIQMENNTRIYHITAYTRDFKHISDLYFMDGNGKTLDLRFEARTDVFDYFSYKIRDMVEGIGGFKVPQG